jgi:hypothetical protein
MKMVKKGTIVLVLVVVGPAVFHGCSRDHPTDITNAGVAEAFPLYSQQGGNGPQKAPFWTLGGNKESNPLTDFVGTSDNRPLVFRTNGVEGMRVLADGRVGIGTTAPQAALNIRRRTHPVELHMQETVAGEAVNVFFQNRVRTWRIDADASPDHFEIQTGGGGSARSFRISGTNGYVGIGTGGVPAHPLQMGNANGAHVTAGGVWTDASSRAYKENIRDLTTDEALAALAALTPVRFNYLTDQDEDYVGFIAEDVPDLVAMGDRDGLSPMDIVAVLTKVVQEQGERIAQLEARLDTVR